MMNKMLSALICSGLLSACSEPNSQPQEHDSASHSNAAQTDPSSANNSNPSASRNTAHNQPNPDKNTSQNDRLQSAQPIQNSQPADTVQRKANSKVFKVLDNNPDDYGEESYQIQTTEGQLSIYTLNLSRHNAAALSEVKAGDCLKLTLKSGNFQAMQGFIAIDELRDAAIQACP